MTTETLTGKRQGNDCKGAVSKKLGGLEEKRYVLCEDLPIFSTQ